jgi:ferredoxin
MAEDESQSWRVEVDRDVCMGSGLCVVYASETFDIDDEARSFVKEPVGGEIAQVRAAVEACPTGALRLRETTDR